MPFFKSEKKGNNMKIIRFLSGNIKVLYGAYNQDQPGVARLIEGDIFGDYRVTSNDAQIVKLLAPLMPVNILALGINYKTHGDETSISYPEQPVLFLKVTTSIVGHEGPIILPAAGPDHVDYEGELAVIIGRKAKNIKPAAVMDYILGYTCANDVSARDWQFDKQKGQWARGKSFDTFCPLGPWIVPKDDIADPDNLSINTVLNGNVVQAASTAQMIFNIREILSNLSKSMTLLPGTVILTGTPAGVGFTRQPPLFLREGDVVSVEIEKIGTLTNKVIREENVTDEINLSSK
jgi:2-keto-4-pentenoate hydratase/2-oxohepta-3-ene-1,7-dioic acid hydratase in catechol pathway